IREIMALADRINQVFDTAQPWVMARSAAVDETQRTALHLVCSQAIAGFKAMSVMLAPVLPVLAQRVARELFLMDRDFVWSDITAPAARIAPYQHRMQRVDPKMLDALFEAPAAEAKSAGNATAKAGAAAGATPANAVAASAVAAV